ncbi:MAG: DUF4190 domain-containing protein [Mycobacterium sp.]
MTLPGGDSGDKPCDETGQDPVGGLHEAPPAEQGAPPAYEQPSTSAPAGYPPPSGYRPPPGPPAPPYGTPPGLGYGAQFPPGDFTAQDPYGYGHAPPQQHTNTMAIASLVISLLGIVPFCGGILSIVGIVLGAVALSQIKETRQEGYGIAVAGIVVGVAMLIVGLIWTIFALR